MLTQMLTLYWMRQAELGLGIGCEEYVRAAGSPYAVAENWNGDANGLLFKIGKDLKASKFHSFHSVCYPCRSYNSVEFIIHYTMIEGSLEVKLPTIWTDEKQSREEAERRERLEERRVRRKKMQMREKVGKSGNTVFFQ